MSETGPYRGWDPTHLRREIGRLHEEMQSMAVLAEIDRGAVEQLRAERDRLRGEVAALREVLRRLEWYAMTVDLPTRAGCPICGNTKEHGHRASCDLARALDAPDAVPADARGERVRAVIAAAMAWVRTFHDVQWARKFGEAVTPLMEGALYQASCTLEDALSKMRRSGPPAGREGGE